MPFKTMDPALIRDLIKDEPDVITPVAKMEEQLLSSVPCPVCGNRGSSKKILAPKFIPQEDGSLEVIRSPFSKDSSTIQGHAKCDSCGAEFDPMTRVIISQDEPVLTDPRSAQ